MFYQLTGRRTAVSLFSSVLMAVLGLGLLFSQLHSAAPQKTEDLALGYGANVAAWDVAKIQTMGFNWMKVFNAPGSRLPVNVVMRVQPSARQFHSLAALSESLRQLAQWRAGLRDAYEIGTDANVHAAAGWAAPPNAADYAALLCTAYSQIKAADPQAKVISAGLAPTGRGIGTWNGHPGHNGLYQDEREFLKECLAAGGGNCRDAL